MPRLRLSAYRAAITKDGIGTQIDFAMAGSPPHPTEVVTVKTAADCDMYLRDYAARAQTHGRGMACFMAIVNGDRAPRGFNALNDTLYVNLDIEPRV